MKRMYAYYFHGKDGNDHGEKLLKEISGYVSIKECLSYMILNFHGKGYPYVGEMNIIYEARETGKKPYVWVFQVEDGRCPLEEIRDVISTLEKNYMDLDAFCGVDLGIFYEAYLYFMSLSYGAAKI